MELTELLKKAVELGGSDLFIVPGSGVMVKVNNEMNPLTGRLLPADTETLVRSMYELACRDIDHLMKEGDDDFSFAIKDVSRFRCNAYKQRGTIAAICRIVNFELPDPEAMHIPQAVLNLAEQRSGMVLVTGPAGSGKSRAESRKTAGKPRRRYTCTIFYSRKAGSAMSSSRTGSSCLRWAAIWRS